jgi:hypothetical protein
MIAQVTPSLARRCKDVELSQVLVGLAATKEPAPPGLLSAVSAAAIPMLPTMKVRTVCTLVRSLTDLVEASGKGSEDDCRASLQVRNAGCGLRVVEGKCGRRWG